MSINQRPNILGQILRRIVNAISGSMLAILLMSPSAKAITIEYSTQNLGGNVWEYAYFVSGNTFNQFQGFQIDFDYNFYSALDSFPPVPNADWSPITFDPDPGLFANGVYDAIALVSNASLADPFVVSFNWLGIGQPSSQAFSLYSCEDEFCSTGITFGQAGVTVTQNGGGEPNPVPEPLTPLLIALGIMGMAFVLQRNRTIS